ncbi:transglycosylase [Escherichia coli]|nr:transglycosylase [Escherichia coli]EIH4817222.1 transglycosylase [Escherichia coli]
MGMDSHPSTSEDSLTNAAGIGAGGPLWMAARGMFDITKEITVKVKNLKEWVGSVKSDSSSAEDKSPALTYPSPEYEKKPASSTAFSNVIEAKSVSAVEEQTKVLQSNDVQIIDELETISEEIIKLRKSLKKSGNGFNLTDFFKPGRRYTSHGRKKGNKNKRNKNKTKKDNNTNKNNSKDNNKNKEANKNKGANKNNDNETNKDNNKKTTKNTEAEKDKVKKDKSKTTTKEGERTKENGDSKEQKQQNKNNSTTNESRTNSNSGTGKKSVGDATKTAEATVDKSAKKAVGERAAKAATETTAEKVAITTGESLAKKEAGKVALKAAGGAAVRAGIRGIPIIGNIAMAGYDAIDGYTDTDAQKAAFGLSDDDAVSTQQKTAYAAANVLDMGGLVSGVSNLIGKGISALGFESTGEILQNFDTGDIARSLNNSVEVTKSAFTSLKDSFLSADDKNLQIRKAVEDDTSKTVNAIKNLGEQLQGGRDGEDGVGEHGYTSPDEFNAPTSNTIAADLNIGGSNAKNRNYRNNNLGNLVFANQEGATLEARNAKGEQRFARFNTPEEGIRALANQVSSYYNGTSQAAGYQKLQTVSSIISKWAPPKENNTNQYIENVSKYLRVSPNEKIDVANPEVMTQLVRAIATKEGGNPAVNNEFIKNALGSYNASTRRWEGQFSDETLAKLNKIQKENGGQLIARDSQYSVGRKVKYADGSSPAQPVSNAVPTATQKPIEVAQHAQAAKKPGKTAEKATLPEQDNSDTNGGKSSSILDTLISKRDNDISSFAESFGGPAASFVVSNLELLKDFATATSFDSLSSISEKAKGIDKSLSEKIYGLTGKSFAFKEASQEAEITDAIKKGKKPKSDTPTVDLLSDISPVTDGIEPPVNSRGIPVFNNGNKVIEGEDKGFFGSLLDSSLTGGNRIGSAVLPAIGDNVSQLVSGMDGTGILNDLVYEATGQNSAIARAISPLTKNAGSWLNNGIQQTADSIKGLSGNANNAIFGSASAVQEPFLAMPPQLPTVTDLARSGIRQPLTTDTANNDPAMLKALENVCSILKDLLNVNKNNTKGDPDKVVKTSQPQPRPRASTNINDPSLDTLLED